MAKLTARGTHEVNRYSRRYDERQIMLGGEGPEYLDTIPAYVRTIVVRSDETVLSKDQFIRDGRMEQAHFTINAAMTRQLRKDGLETYMRKLAKWERGDGV